MVGPVLAISVHSVHQHLGLETPLPPTAKSFAPPAQCEPKLGPLLLIWMRAITKAGLCNIDTSMDV